MGRNIYFLPDIERLGFNQHLSLLKLDDPYTVTFGAYHVIYGSLVQKEAAVAGYGTDEGMFCYISPDLEYFAGPFLVAEPIEGISSFTAPKVIRHKNNFFMFAKCRKDSCDCLAVLTSENPLGKFILRSVLTDPGHVTPFTDAKGNISLLISSESGMSVAGFDSKKYTLYDRMPLKADISPVCPPVVTGADNGSISMLVSTAKGISCLNADLSSHICKSKSVAKRADFKVESVFDPYPDSPSKVLVCTYDSHLIFFELRTDKKRIGISKLSGSTGLSAPDKNDGQSDETSTDNGKKGIDLPFDLSAVAALLIALFTAGIGITIGLKNTHEPKPKKKRKK